MGYDKHQLFAKMCDLLYSMEVELGISQLPYAQKRILQVAAGCTDKSKNFNSIEVQTLCAERYLMSRATYFRALTALKKSDWVREVRGPESGTYRLNL